MRGTVAWFVGLSGSGKTTISMAVGAVLENRKQPVAILDGDKIRKGLCSDLGFEPQDRAENIRRIAHVADLLAENGNTVLVATISPLAIHRELARHILPNLFEIFVDAPLHICEARDPKGLYQLARAGKLPGLTGIDSPFETPTAATLVCNTAQESLAESVRKVLDIIAPEAIRVDFERRHTLAVDFDGVIADYEGWRGANELGSLRKDVVWALTQLREEGWKIIVHTSRGVPEVQRYLLLSGVPFDEINQNSDYNKSIGSKPVATVYWDDRAVPYSGDAFKDIWRIRNFKTWSGRS